MPSALELLPNELLDQVISCLSNTPPSSTRLHHPPAHQLSNSQCGDLKHLSQVSSRLLSLVRPQLFKHARLELRDEPAFHSFMAASGLGPCVTSLLISLPSAALDLDLHNQYWWRRILSYLDPTWITVIAPPTFIGNALNTQIMNGHSWAFEIDFQVLRLKRDGRCGDISPQTDLAHCDNLLLARPWTSMFFNEASSLKAYNHYEYFLSRVPSIFGEWGSRLKNEDFPSMQLSTSLSRLTSFSYTAVFPFYNHVKLVLDTLALMPSLRTLSVQLAPGADNNITEVEQRASMDPNDPWMELATAYSLIAFEVCGKQSLKVFQSRDFPLEALRMELCQILDDGLGHTSWTHDGQGTWRRRIGTATNIVE
ncbi:hypothetical protein N7492_008597 [Penicillium capsulatum]|uniref:F-box domain-containing protein n=1 Tax=Penicillium capsulatum TaxID=69766 RepID=A0A9W9HVK9_9EURO|nr:hypothetical protein N7492_008597 [Penicillium capsulatum]KAJ6106002.1 hypothetical protein N7512_009519 [Penicillium capsulatum]